jgi:TonB family protein
LKLVKITISIAISLVLFGIYSPARAQSGRVKTAPKRPTVEVVPVKTRTPSAAEKSKKFDHPQFVDGERVYLNREVDSKAFIWKRPAPGTTKEAKRESFHGKIVLEAILAANGKVTNITILKSLPYGLNQKALEAAQQIRFEPAMKDGKPVSVWVQIEYEFWCI